MKNRNDEFILYLCHREINIILRNHVVKTYILLKRKPTYSQSCNHAASEHKTSKAFSTFGVHFISTPRFVSPKGKICNP